MRAWAERAARGRALFSSLFLTSLAIALVGVPFFASAEVVFVRHTSTAPFDGGARGWAIDIEPDGDVDYVAAYYNTARVYINNGLGNFTSPLFFSTGGANVYGVDVADMDGDGDIDILCTPRDAPTQFFAIRRNGGVSTLLHAFEASDHLYFTQGSGTYSLHGIATADLSGDGLLDVLGFSAATNVFYSQNLGGMAFTPPSVFVPFSSSADWVQWSKYRCDFDMNMDGRVDCLTRTVGSGDFRLSNPRLFYSTPTGFLPPSDCCSGCGSCSSGAEFELADLLNAKRLTHMMQAPYYGGAHVMIWTVNLTTGMIDFSLPRGIIDVNPDFPSANGLAVGDYDLDGWNDLIVSGVVGFLNLDHMGPARWSTAFFSFLRDFGGVEVSMSSCFGADVDGDGDTDYIGLTPQVVWFENQGASTYNLTGAGINVTAVTAAELTGDLAHDLVYADSKSKSLVLIHGVGTTSLALVTAPRVTLVTGLTGNITELFAVDQTAFDGVLDVLALSAAAGLQILPNRGGGLFASSLTTLIEPAFAPRTICTGCAQAECKPSTNGGDCFADIIWSNGTALYWTAARAATAPPAHTLLVAAVSVQTCMCLDLAGDGALDLVWTDSVNGRVVGIRGTASGQFTAAPVVLDAAATAARSLDACDYNGDGALDLAYIVSNSTARLLLSAQATLYSGGLMPPEALNSSFLEPKAQRLQCMDRNGDGIPDLLLSSTTRASWYELNGTAMLESPGRLTIPSFSVINANFDGAPDLAVILGGSLLIYETRRLFPNPVSLVVRPHACGFSGGCFRNTIAFWPTRLPNNYSPLGWRFNVLVPAGIYHGCFSAAPLQFADSIAVHPSPLSANWTLVCAASVGGTFVLASDGADVLMTGLSVRGGSFSPVSLGTSAFRATGAGTQLTLRYATVSDCDSSGSITASTTQSFQGSGPALLVEGSASAVLDHVTLSGNRGGSSGGAIAFVDGLALSMDSVVMRGNTAAAGHGGAMYVSVTPLVGQIAQIRATNCEITDNSAGIVHAGGGLYAFGVVNITLSGTVLARNSAKWGGGLAALARVALPDVGVVASVQLPVGAVTASTAADPQISFRAPFTLRDNSASNGGLLYSCGLPVGFQGGSGGSGVVISGNAASVAAPLAFLCAVPTASAFGPVGLGPWVSADASAAAALASAAAAAAATRSVSAASTRGYSSAAGAATPPVALSIAAVPSSLVPGAQLSSPVIAVTLTDALGSTVIDSDVSVQLTIAHASPPGAFVLQGARSAAVESAPLYFERASIGVLGNTSGSEPSFGSLGLSVSVQASVSPISGTAASVSVAKCPRGWGGSAPGAAAFTCSPCPALSYLNLANTTEACRPCPAGTIDEGVGAVACSYCSAHADRVRLPDGTPACSCNAGYKADVPTDNLSPCNQCPRLDSCLANSVCAAGSDPASLRCKSCKKGYYSDSSGRCRVCAAASGTAAETVVSIGFAIAAIGVAMLSIRRAGKLQRALASVNNAAEAGVAGASNGGKALATSDSEAEMQLSRTPPDSSSSSSSSAAAAASEPASAQVSAASSSLASADVSAERSVERSAAWSAAGSSARASRSSGSASGSGSLSSALSSQAEALVNDSSVSSEEDSVSAAVAAAEAADPSPFHWTRRAPLIMRPLAAAAMTSQVVSYMGDGDWNWPNSTRNAMTSLRFVALDFAAVVNECNLGSFHRRYAQTMLTPLVVVAIGVLFVALLYPVSLLSRSVRTPSVTGVLLEFLLRLGPLMYLPLARATLALFDCSRLSDGLFYVDQDLGVRCLDTAWYSLLPYGIVGLIVYVIGIPGAMMALLLRARSRLYRDARVIVLLGPMYMGYTRAFSGGEIMMMAKRLLFAIIMLFLNRHRGWQFTLLAALFLFAVAVHSRNDVLIEPRHNQLELYLSLNLTVILLFGIGFAGNLIAGVAFEVLAIGSVVMAYLMIAVTLLMDVRDAFARDKELLQHKLEAAAIHRFQRLAREYAGDAAQRQVAVLAATGLTAADADIELGTMETDAPPSSRMSSTPPETPLSRP